jgi:hypothetical protein
MVSVPAACLSSGVSKQFSLQCLGTVPCAATTVHVQNFTDCICCNHAAEIPSDYDHATFRLPRALRDKSPPSPWCRGGSHHPGCCLVLPGRKGKRGRGCALFTGGSHRLQVEPSGSPAVGRLARGGADPGCDGAVSFGTRAPADGGERASRRTTSLTDTFWGKYPI